MRYGMPAGITLLVIQTQCWWILSYIFKADILSQFLFMTAIADNVFSIFYSFLFLSLFRHGLGFGNLAACGCFFSADLDLRAMLWR